LVPKTQFKVRGDKRGPKGNHLEIPPKEVRRRQKRTCCPRFWLLKEKSPKLELRNGIIRI